MTVGSRLLRLTLQRAGWILNEVPPASRSLAENDWRSQAGSGAVAFVLNSRGATLQNGKLVLTGVSPNAIVFADRPVRAAGHDLTSRIVEDWGSGSYNFSKDPPNATIAVFQKDGSGVRDAVVVLKTPKLEGENLAFDVDLLEGDIKGADGAASLFIDIIGRPLTPMSFAGVARRTAYRGAYYAGAAAVEAAAVGAAAAYGAYEPRPACGYYLYPPCY